MYEQAFTGQNTKADLFATANGSDNRMGTNISAAGRIRV
jgi:hypothetical protein